MDLRDLYNKKYKIIENYNTYLNNKYYNAWNNIYLILFSPIKMQ